MEQKTKFILLGLGVVALGTGGYFLIKHLSKKSELKATNDFKSIATDDELIKEPIQKLIDPPKERVRVIQGDSDFPLKLKSRGALVRDVQNALIKKYGSRILPKFGADGFYGDELFNALLSKKLPTWIDSKAYVQIVSINDKSKADDKSDDEQEQTDEWGAERISKYLHKAIQNQNIFYALDALKKIKSKSQYTEVNSIFKQKKIPVSKTIVNALFEVFTTSDYKKKINEQLYRIGLKYDGAKWSLSGILNGLVTIEETQIWDIHSKSLNVPKNTLLGDFVSVDKNGVVTFLSHDQKHLFVRAKSVVSK